MPRENPDKNERSLARRPKPLTGRVEDYRRREEDEPDEGPSPEDLERFGDVTVKCRGCGTELYDDVAVCWNCGRAVMASDGEGGVPWWAMVAAIVGGAALLVVMMM